MYIKSVISLVVVFTSLTFGVQAQGGKYGATPEDSLKCVRNLSVYVDFMKQEDYVGANKHWRVPFDVCPKSSLKMYVDGVKMYKDFIDEEEDEVRKQQLIDTLMLIHDRRIENFGQEGYNLGRKGYYMYKYDKNGPGEAFKTMNKSVELQGNESEAATLIYYFAAATDLEEKGQKTKGEVVELYTKVINIIDYNLKNETNERVRDSYVKAEEYISAKASSYLSCEVIEGIANKKYEVGKDDAEWLAKMADLLDKKDCTASTTFFKVANRLHELKPSAESANNMGVLAITSKKYADAEKFFQQAIQMIGDKDNTKKSDYEFNLSKTYFAQGKYAQARTHALNAANLRPGWGAPYILIGDMYAASKATCPGKDSDLGAIYWIAVDMYIKAKSVDASVTEDANKKIATYSQYFPKKEDAFFNSLNDGDSYTLECWIGQTTTVRVK